MSSCEASTKILALNKLDLDILLPFKREKKPFEKAIDIQLDCLIGFNGDGPDDVQGNLNVISWGGKSDLCGSCAFCNLLVDGLRRTPHGELKTCMWALHEEEFSRQVLDEEYRNFSWSHDQPPSAEYGKIFNVKIDIKKLSYHKDSYQWAVGGKNVYTWDLHLVLFRASAIASLGNGQSEPINMDVAFEIFGEENDPFVRHMGIHRRPLETSPISETNIKKIMSWMHSCDEHHDSCWVDYQKDFLPTRLLDVGLTDILSSRLVISSEKFPLGLKGSKSPRYMALSYCWGNPKDARALMTTTHGTFSERLSGISISSMPQAFQDAVTLARALGIGYIWIDSLCIIQDDTSDWQTESSRMAEIFSNAYITVVAATGSSCHDSFLQRDLPRPNSYVNFKSNQDKDLEGKFGLRFRRHWGTDRMCEIRNSRWSTRGWTFQEERLARRVLMFAESKFFFECGTFERCEETNMGKFRPNWVESIREVSRSNTADSSTSKQQGTIPHQRRTSYDHWQTLCSHYSKRQLTFPTDKLPAISGIASKIAKKEQSRYLAGIWGNYLMHDLFWRTVAMGFKPSTYRAPSWSWASLDGQILWPTWRNCAPGECKFFCEILDAQTKVEGLDPYGAVSDGWLKVSGTFIKVDIDFPDKDQTTMKHPWPLRFKGNVIANASLDTPLPKVSLKSYWALIAATCNGKLRKAPVPRGLLLERSDRIWEDGLEVFQRVGIFQVSSRGPKEEESLQAWENSDPQAFIIV